MIKRFLLSLTIGFLMIGMVGTASATMIKITADSSVYGELGWFAVDDAIFATDTILVASQFVNYSWLNPITNDSINPTDVPSDTGVTYFSFVGSDWTVTGGGGDSLTTATSKVWIYGNYGVVFGINDFDDVTWSTTDYTPGSSVPEPATLLLLGFGLLGVAGVSRKKN